MKAHSIDIRVYYEDTDAGGVVFYGSYMRFCERGRTELLRAINVNNSDIFESDGVFFVVRKLTADYFLPALLDDMLTLTTSVERIGGASMDMKQVLTRDGVKIFEMDVVMVCIDTNKRPAKWPDVIRNGLSE